MAFCPLEHSLLMCIINTVVSLVSPFTFRPVTLVFMLALSKEASGAIALLYTVSGASGTLRQVLLGLSVLWEA